jgi:hypothetical protein
VQRGHINRFRLDSLYADDLGDLFLQHSFYAVGQSQLRHRTASAGTLESDLHYSLIGDVDQLDITAVSLESRTNLIEYRLNLRLVHMTLLEWVDSPVQSSAKAPATL